MKPSAAEIERVMMQLLDERGTATACPSEIARRLVREDGREDPRRREDEREDPRRREDRRRREDPRRRQDRRRRGECAVPREAWRALMPAVRAAAARLQRAGRVDAYQRGRPVRIGEARGPIRLRARAAAEIDYRAEPERYVVGRGEQGVLTVEPYKSELLPLWRFKTPAIARASAASLVRAFEAYRDADDFVGMDMARKFLQMGWTRARRYANHRTGRKWRGAHELPREPDAVKAESAQVFRRAYERVLRDPVYAKALAAKKRRSPERGIDPRGPRSRRHRAR